MLHYDRTIQVSSINNFSPETFGNAFPGTCLPFDDAFLNAEGFARISSPSDYSYDNSTQQLVPQTSVYNANTGLWDAYVVQSIPAATLLVNAQINAIAALGALYTQKIAAGLNYQSNNFQIDSASLQNMIAVDVQLTKGVTAGYTGYWVATNNTQVTFSNTDILTFFNAAYAYVAALDNNFFTLRTQISSAKDIASVQTIDITKNWPSN